MNKIKLQLSEFKFNDTKVQVVNKILLMQKCLIKTIMTILNMIIEEEFCWHNTAIDIVAAYCYFQEDEAITILYERLLI